MHRLVRAAACAAALALSAGAAHAATVESLATLAKGRAALEALVQNPDGSFWMTSNFDRALWRITPKGEIVQKIDLDFAPQVVVRRPGGGLIVTGHLRIPAGAGGGGAAAAPGTPPPPPDPNRMVGLGTRVAILGPDLKIAKVLEGPEVAFFNGVDPMGGDRYLIADSIGGSLWRLDAGKGELERWLTDVSVQGPQGVPSFGGSNGLKVHGGYVYYTSRGSMWRERIGRDGEADGAPAEFATIGNDDFDIARDGTVYLPQGRDLMRISPSGEVTKLLEVGVACPTARLSKDEKSLYVLTRGIVPPGGGEAESKFMVVHLDR